MAALTWKAAFRFRLFWVLAGLLLASVVFLPLLLKDDGTARGFTQILLTYNLSVITALLGFSTLWLACGTLARDIEDCQLQMVAVKPIPRWRIWLGKWVGIMLLNATLLLITGASVYGLLMWRAQKLPPDQRDVLRNEIFVARASLKEPTPDLDSAADRILKERLAKTPVPPANQPLVRKQILEQLQAGVQVVPPDHLRRWTLDLGLEKVFLVDQPLFLRVKFHAAQTNATGTYLGLWQIGSPGSPQAVSRPMSLAPDAYHEIRLPPNLFDQNGILTVTFINRNDTALLFPLEDGFEVLYRQGGFGTNFIRGLLIILSWLGFLAALGLSAASLLSFPVAAFCSLSLLIVAFSSGTLASVVQEGTVTGVNHETGAAAATWIDAVLIPIFKFILKVVGLVQGYSPIEALSTGRSIPWGELFSAWGQVVLLLGGFVALVGMIILTRRELALPQGSN
jgi:hypothetical protein